MARAKTTQILHYTRGHEDEAIREAAAILARGGLVAIPTETVYGLAANALDSKALEGIFRAKGRPKWDPLIVHISDLAMLDRVVREISPDAGKLMKALWPGPLTLLLPRRADLPKAVTAGRDLVGVRMPAHPAALALIRQANLPLAAPSANRFGHISPSTAQHVLDDLDGRIEAVLDAGPSSIGVESTVFDPNEKILYRQGGISQHEIEAVLGQPVTVYAGSGEPTGATPESLPSPGLDIRHYAPKATVVLVSTQEELDRRFAELSGPTTGVLLPQGWTLPTDAVHVFHWERWEDAAALARTLYTCLRALDAFGVDIILCPLPAASSEPLVEAIRDRLQKAARTA